MRQEIEDFRLAKGIPYFLHFTRSENLPSIMLQGLVPRSEIDCGNCEATTNDDLRLDGRRNFNCISATFPNSVMFHRFKSDNPDAKWIILVIHPLIISRRHTLFCWRNAASAEISCVPEAELSNLQSFQGLFEERDGLKNRAEQYLKDSDPTDVQAEFLVNGIIPAAAIYCVIFPDKPTQLHFSGVIGDRQSIVSDRRGFYGTRQYYRQWGYGKNG